MILSKALLLKGLAGVTALTGAVGLGVVGHNSNWWRGSIDPALKKLIEKVGLSCNLENICTQVSGKTTNIKKDSDLDGKTLTTTGTGKIKVYKDTEGYNEKFKFVIEDGDISINGDSANKLEQFETYEIKEEGENTNKKWYFSRKKKASENIRETLGLPEGCTLENTSCSDVEVDTTKIAAMKFDGLTKEQTPSISASAKLTVTKLSTSDTDYPLDYKFELKGKDSTATLTLGSKTITLRQNETTEFKIKENSASNLTLEKAWTAKSLGEKVGLVCEESSSTEGKCTFNDGKINVNNSNSNSKIEGAKVKEGSTDKKITYLENQENYNQGFKFTVEGNSAIALTKEGSGSTTLNIENNNASYEIKKDSSDSKWYLTKKTTNGG